MATSFENIHSQNYAVEVSQSELDKILKTFCEGIYVFGDVSTYHTHGATIVLNNQREGSGLFRLMTEGSNVEKIIKYLQEITRKDIMEIN